jgi:phosphoglycerate dehydrogenase-like enzyme
MDEIFSPDDRQRLYDQFEVIWGQDEPMPMDEFLTALPEAEALVCANWRYSDVYDQAQNLRAVVTVSGGYPLDIDYAKCYQRQIRILLCAPAFAPQVAEMALGMALAASREIVIGDRGMRDGSETWQRDLRGETFMLFGQRIGLIGFGNLARALMPLLQPFGCEIVAYDPWLGDGYLRRQGVEPVSLETLMRTSRVIFVLAVPSAENPAMISREYLEMIQPGAVFALISRAYVVDFDALTELVLAERFKAAIDVFPYEPLDPDHPIRGARYAVLSAHRAGSVNEGRWQIGEMVIDDLEAITRGLPPMRMQVAQPEFANRYATLRPVNSP